MDNFKEISIRKKKSIIAIFLVFAILISSAIAFLTTSDSKTNKFVVGNIKIELWENFNGALLGPEDGDPTVDLSNSNVQKEPWILNTGSRPAYVYMSVGIPTNEDGEEVISLNDISDEWTKLSKTESDDSHNYYLYSYDDVLDSEKQTEALFESVSVLSEKISTSQSADIYETIRIFSDSLSNYEMFFNEKAQEVFGSDARYLFKLREPLSASELEEVSFYFCRYGHEEVLYEDLTEEEKYANDCYDFSVISNSSDQRELIIYSLMGGIDEQYREYFEAAVASYEEYFDTTNFDWIVINKGEDVYPIALNVYDGEKRGYYCFNYEVSDPINVDGTDYYDIYFETKTLVPKIDTNGKKIKMGCSVPIYAYGIQAENSEREQIIYEAARDTNKGFLYDRNTTKITYTYPSVIWEDSNRNQNVEYARCADSVESLGSYIIDYFSYDDNNGNGEYDIDEDDVDSGSLGAYVKVNDNVEFYCAPGSYASGSYNSIEEFYDRKRGSGSSSDGSYYYDFSFPGIINVSGKQTFSLFGADITLEDGIYSAIKYLEGEHVQELYHLSKIIKINSQIDLNEATILDNKSVTMYMGNFCTGNFIKVSDDTSYLCPYAFDYYEKEGDNYEDIKMYSNELWLNSDGSSYVLAYDCDCVYGLVVSEIDGIKFIYNDTEYTIPHGVWVAAGEQLISNDAGYENNANIYSKSLTYIDCSDYSSYTKATLNDKEYACISTLVPSTTYNTSFRFLNTYGNKLSAFSYTSSSSECSYSRSNNEDVYVIFSGSYDSLSPGVWIKTSSKISKAFVWSGVEDFVSGAPSSLFFPVYDQSDINTVYEYKYEKVSDSLTAEEFADYFWDTESDDTLWKMKYSQEQYRRNEKTREYLSDRLDIDTLHSEATFQTLRYDSEERTEIINSIGQNSICVGDRCNVVFDDGLWLLKSVDVHVIGQSYETGGYIYNILEYIKDDELKYDMSSLTALDEKVGTANAYSATADISFKKISEEMTDETFANLYVTAEYKEEYYGEYRTADYRLSHSQDNSAYASYPDFELNIPIVLNIKSDNISVQLFDRSYVFNKGLWIADFNYTDYLFITPKIISDDLTSISLSESKETIRYHFYTTMCLKGVLKRFNDVASEKFAMSDKISFTETKPYSVNFSECCTIEKINDGLYAFWYDGKNGEYDFLKNKKIADDSDKNLKNVILLCSIGDNAINFNLEPINKDDEGSIVLSDGFYSSLDLSAIDVYIKIKYDKYAVGVDFVTPEREELFEECFKSIRGEL